MQAVPTRQVLRMPADLMLLLHRQALSEYSLACESAQIAAERCGAVQSPTADARAELRNCRARVIAAEDALDLLADDVATRETWDVSLDDRSRDLITRLVGTALDRVGDDFEASDQEILDAADRIQRLQALLDELGPGDRPNVRRWDRTKCRAYRRFVDRSSTPTSSS